MGQAPSHRNKAALQPKYNLIATSFTRATESFGCIDAGLTGVYGKRVYHEQENMSLGNTEGSQKPERDSLFICRCALSVHRQFQHAYSLYSV